MLGTCPIPLTITKWFDRNGDGASAGEPPLLGVPFTITRNDGAQHEDVATTSLSA